MVAVPYLAASYFAQAAFKETAEALFVLAFASACATPAPCPRAPGRGCASRSAYLALAGGIFFSYSFAGLAWPVAIVALWSLTLPAVRRALRAALAAALPAATGDAAGDPRPRRPRRRSSPLVGPFGFASGFNKVAGSNTYGPVSPIEALGVWPTSNYRLDAPGGAQLTGLAGAIAVLALLVAASPGGCAGATSPCRSRSAPAPSSTSPRSRSAATTRRPRR